MRGQGKRAYMLNGKNLNKKRYSKSGMIITLLFAALYFFTASFYSYGAENESTVLAEATCLTFVIPAEFVPSEEGDVFIDRNYPMESSSISYSFQDIGTKMSLTNREKQALLESSEPVTADERDALTKDIYEKELAKAYNAEYGEDVGFKVQSFDKITIDGFPGYRIYATYQASDEEVIHQTVYILLSKYRTFTVTFQRADDDESEEIFSGIADTIHVR